MSGCVGFHFKFVRGSRANRAAPGNCKATHVPLLLIPDLIHFDESLRSKFPCNINFYSLIIIKSATVQVRITQQNSELMYVKM